MNVIEKRASSTSEELYTRLTSWIVDGKFHELDFTEINKFTNE